MSLQKHFGISKEELGSSSTKPLIGRMIQTEVSMSESFTNDWTNNDVLCKTNPSMEDQAACSYTGMDT